MKSLLSLTFDDGLRCQFDRALPILNSHGLHATFFLIANQDPTQGAWSGHTNDWWKIDWREDDIALLKEVIRDGHEVGSHSVTHHPDRMPEQPEVEVYKSKQLIEGWLGTAISSFCYPFYKSHAYLARPVKNAGYEQARGGGIPPLYVPRCSHYAISRESFLDPFNVDCRPVSRNEKVNEWMRPGYWHVLTYHGIGSIKDGSTPISPAQFAAHVSEIARHRDSGVVDVVTFREGADRLRRASIV